MGSSQKKALWTVAVSTPLTTAYCPTRRSPLALPLPQYWISNPYDFKNINYTSSLKQGHTDYAINGGPTRVANGWTPSIDGISYSQSTVRMATITDGTTNTYLIGEKVVSSDTYYTSDDVGDGMSAYSGHDWNICRWTYYDATNPANSFAPMQDQSGYVDPRCFGSAHSSGLNMAFCDGSVRSISYSIDLLAHSLLGNRHDDKPIDGSVF
jgi:prepilin-type processing-associated H-X9-DG protein